MRPAAAVIALTLPDSSGTALCGTLKRLYPDLPVALVFDGKAATADARAAWDAGANICLEAPIEPEVLRSTLMQIVNGAQHTADVPETWLLTDVQGFILNASPDGARLLSGTLRGLHQRNLIVFFEQDRDAWRDAMLKAADGGRVSRSGRLRPKERRPVMVSVEIERTDDELSPALLWTFRLGDGASRAD